MYEPRTFIAIIKYNEWDNLMENLAPGDFLKQEMRGLGKGLWLSDWALVDGDYWWERYIKCLVQWAIDHSSDEYKGMSPPSFEEWKRVAE